MIKEDFHISSSRRRPGSSRRYKRILAGAIPLALLLLCRAPSLAAVGSDDSLIFGVFPYLPTKRMEQIYSPLAARFGELTGRPVTLRSRPDFSRFREQVRQQAYDIIFIQPFDYVRAAANSGYIPLARWVASDKPDDLGNLRAIIVTRADSGVDSLDDLDGQAVAVPHPEAAVSLLGRSALAEHHVKTTLHVAGNHLACLQQMQVKRVAACITAQPPVKLFEKKHGVRLKQVYKTRMIPSSLFAVHKRVPAEQRALLEKELLSWRTSNPVQKTYLSNGAWTRLYPAADKDYDIVRTIWAEVGHADP